MNNNSNLEECLVNLYRARELPNFIRTEVRRNVEQRSSWVTESHLDLSTIKSSELGQFSERFADQNYVFI